MPSETVDLIQKKKTTKKEWRTMFIVALALLIVSYTLVSDESFKMAAKKYRLLLDPPHGLGILRFKVEALARL